MQEREKRGEEKGKERGKERRGEGEKGKEKGENKVYYDNSRRNINIRTYKHIYTSIV